MHRNLERALVYIDNQDPNNVGWAYRAVFNDGHHESDSVDMDLDDESGQVLIELQQTVEKNGGVWDAGDWSYHDYEGGFYLWEAA